MWKVYIGIEFRVQSSMSDHQDYEFQQLEVVLNTFNTLFPNVHAQSVLQLMMEFGVLLMVRHCMHRPRCCSTKAKAKHFPFLLDSVLYGFIIIICNIVSCYRLVAISRSLLCKSILCKSIFEMLSSYYRIDLHKISNINKYTVILPIKPFVLCL